VSELIPSLIWVAIAAAGLLVLRRAVNRNAALLGAAQAERRSLATLRLQGTVLLYRIRLFLVGNNLLLGLLALASQLHLIALPSAYGYYVLGTLLLNELSFIALTYREERIERRLLAAGEVT